MSLVQLIRFESVEVEAEREDQLLLEQTEKDYQRGYQEGIAEMERKYKIETETKARTIVAGIAQLSDRIHAISTTIEGQAGELAASAINSVLPELARRGLAGEMALAVRELVGHLEPPQLRITGPEMLLDAIKLQLDLTDSTTPLLPIELDVDKEAAEGHATLEWPTGRAELAHGDVLERVITSLNSLMNSSEKKHAPNTQEGALT